MYEIRYPRNGEFAFIDSDDLSPQPLPRCWGTRFFKTDLPFTYTIYPGFHGPVGVVLRRPLMVASAYAPKQ
jgi:hypothetical protein